MSRSWGTTSSIGTSSSSRFLVLRAPLLLRRAAKAIDGEKYTIAFNIVVICVDNPHLSFGGLQAKRMAFLQYFFCVFPTFDQVSLHPSSEASFSKIFSWAALPSLPPSFRSSTPTRTSWCSSSAGRSLLSYVRATLTSLAAAHDDGSVAFSSARTAPCNLGCRAIALNVILR